MVNEERATLWEAKFGGVNFDAFVYFHTDLVAKLNVSCQNRVLFRLGQLWKKQMCRDFVKSLGPMLKAILKKFIWLFEGDRNPKINMSHFKDSIPQNRTNVLNRPILLDVILHELGLSINYSITCIKKRYRSVQIKDQFLPVDFKGNKFSSANSLYLSN